MGLVWFGLSWFYNWLVPLFSGYLPTFGPAFVHLYGSTCDYILMGLVWHIQCSSWLVSPYFRLPAYL
jgi:hypothetical protein